MYRILVISDLHAGHWAGWNPPEYVRTIPSQKLRVSVEASHAWIANELAGYKRFDLCVINGDAIDGKATRSKGQHLFTSDQLMQCNMAYSMLSELPVRQWKLVRGTEYHTGVGEDMEDYLASLLGADTPQNIQLLEKDGVLMNFRHHQGGTSVPYATATPLKKQAFWSQYVAEDGAKPDIVVRSHVHRYCQVRDDQGVYLSTPALQGWSAYGEKRCDGIINQGFIVIEIRNGSYTIIDHVRRLNLTRRADYAPL